MVGAVVGGDSDCVREDMIIADKVEAVWFGMLGGAALAVGWPVVLAGVAAEVGRRRMRAAQPLLPGVESAGRFSRR
jgi:hypothetical protein